MITVFGFEIALPQALSFFSGTFGSFLGTILASVIVAFILYFFIFGLLKLVFAKTDTEIDDVILGVSRTPFIIFVTILGVEKSLEVWGIDGWIGWVETTLLATIVIVITYWVARLFKDVLVYQLRIYAEKSEAAWDDVLIPVIERILPPVIYVIGGVVFLGIFGVDLTGVYVALGGTAFILAFALQDILSNLFSGLVMLLDTPFQFDDVILLEDGTITVIRKIGLRVTHLYNTSNHSDIFMPNSTLGSMKIVNITRPTTDLAVSFTVGVGYTSDVDKVRHILEQIVHGHPDVLGDIDKKLSSLDDFGEFLSGEDKKTTARKRLIDEKQVNEQLVQLDGYLTKFAQLAKKLETGGLSNEERDELRQVYLAVLNTVGLKAVEERRGWLGRKHTNLKESRETDNLIVSIEKWIKTWAMDPDLVEDDPHILDKEWKQKLDFLRIKTKRLFRYVMNPTGYERRLDDYAKDLARWVKDEFKEAHVKWRDPDVRLVEFGASSLDFEVSVYVDNIKLEHWERADRVKDELRCEITRQFRSNNIEIPFPQTDIWFRSTMELRTPQK